LKKNSLNISRYALPALAFIGFSFFISGCQNFNPTVSYAYVGGEIVNPTIDHVIIKHKGFILDTIKLDEKNRFSYKIENAEEGLYILQHKPEVQNIYISPGDSLLLRANTMAFDESLHFSGKGNAKNNFMAEMFLKDEGNSQLLLNFHEYTPQVFLEKADSIRQDRIAYLAAISEKKNFSDEFNQLAREVINYENYDLRERYTYLVNKYYKDYSRQFPSNFHDYREEIDFNCVNIQCSPGYKRLLENYLINYSLAWCADSDLDGADCYSLTDVANVKARLRKAGELIRVPKIREQLLEKIAVRGIIMAENKENIASILDELEALKFPDKNLEKLKNLATVQLAYLPGTSLAAVPLLNMEGELVSTDDIIRRPTVIFLWSVYDESYQNEHQVIDLYRKKYPEVDFIGINLDLSEEPAWRVAVRQNGYDPATEFQLAPARINKEVFQYFLSKMLFVNDASVVEVGDVYLSSPEFESRLLEFLN
jgi:hypothetical protein